MVVVVEWNKSTKLIEVAIGKGILFFFSPRARGDAQLERLHTGR